jgi:nucleotide-binding universal stress UspA family protein
MITILLGIETSDFSEEAVSAVRRQFRPEQVVIHLLNVIDPMIYLPLYEGAMRDFDRIEALRNENRESAKELVERTAKTLRDAGYQVITAVEEGEPRTTIVDYAKRIKAQLIVVGSHGRRGLPRLLLGSVSEYVTRHAPCSVEIIRELPRAA